MKVVERIFEHRIWQHIDIDDMHFGFMKGKGTTDAILIVREMQEKCSAKGKKLYFGFVDFELDGINSGRWYHCLPIRIYH